MATARTQGRKYPRRQRWNERREEAFIRAGTHCEISGDAIKWWEGPVCGPGGKWVVRRACDHLFPERFVRRFCKAADPHVAENLYVITPALHARKTAIEKHIYKGDFLRYKQELIRLGWDATQIDRALSAIVHSVPGKAPNGNSHTPAAPAA